VESYLDSDDPNPNFVALFWKTKASPEAGIDNKIRLKAKRRHDKWTEDFFKENDGIKTGSEVSISDTQTVPVETVLDGLVVKHSYSRQWLEENLDNPTILNNFIYLFKFADLHMMLNLPSFQAHLGVFERYLVTSGKDDYKTGAYFRSTENGSLLQCVMYDRFLETKDTNIEAVIAWFFSDYLKDEFGADAFKFAPSSRTATYLERCRHLFSEMESVVGQYTLYVEDDAVDHDLLGIAPDQVRYKAIPSVLTGKYVYLGNNADATNILGWLFSDQSGLGYIHEGLRSGTLARLLLENKVDYDSFAEHQRGSIDFLITHGILANTGERVRIASADQFNVLWNVFEKEATSYYHYSPPARAVIDEMAAKGWLVREASLLSKPEVSCFNYYLNNAEFGNGPALRNRYTHGRNAKGNDNEDFHAYFTAVKLLICLVIKMNDDLSLRDVERSRVPASVS